MSASLTSKGQKTPDKTLDAQQALISKVLTVVLILLSAWILGSLIWKFIYPTPELAPWKPVIQSTQTAEESNNEILTLENSDLFGAYSQATVSSEPKKDAPETKLNLTLVGVVASSNAKKSLAIISNRGKQVTYGMNEKITGTNASLVGVLPDRVIISNRGKEETLMLEGIDYSKMNNREAAPTQTRGSTSSNANANGELEKIRASIMADPQEAFNYIRLSQRMVDGELQGYQVRPGNNRLLFDTVGLKDGDIAVAMNGKDLTNPSEMVSLWQDLASASSWELTVERDGQLHQVNVSF